MANNLTIRKDYTPSADVPSVVQKIASGKKVVEVNSEGPAYENEWAILARAILKASAHTLNPKGISICASVVSRVYASPKQQDALIAISKKHTPNLYNKIRLNGQKLN